MNTETYLRQAKTRGIQAWALAIGEHLANARGDLEDLEELKEDVYEFFTAASQRVTELECQVAALQQEIANLKETPA